MPNLPRDYNLSIGLALTCTNRSACDRTVAPKGGRLRSWTGNRDLKMLFMRFDLATSSLLGTSTKA
jgi:hypothetical protein